MSKHLDRPITRWGILGTGAAARAFAGDLRLLPEASLTAVGSRRLDRALVFASEFGARRAHEGVDELASDPEVDIVYVATPHIRHRDDGLACLAAGRAVLLEKPFAVNAAEARAVIEQARRLRLFCMEAMWMRFHPLILKVHAQIRAGALGSIRLLTAEFGYPTPFDPENRFFDRRLAGGALLDRGVYLIALAHLLLGPPDDAVGNATIGPTGVDEEVSLLLIYRSGAQAVLTASLRSRLRNEARDHRHPRADPHPSAILRAPSRVSEPVRGARRPAQTNAFLGGRLENPGQIHPPTPPCR